MRVTIVTESFLPTLNGVTTSVCRVVEQLTRSGHQVSVLAPSPAPEQYAGAPVRTVASVSVRDFPTGIPTRAVRSALIDLAPDVVHVASPFVLGARALHHTSELGIPAVAIYQTDMPAYLAQHAPGLIGAASAGAAWRWVRRIHSRASCTLAPSTATLEELRAHGIPRTARWGRGVDTTLFHPSRADDPAVRAMRRELAPGGEVLVGYVGRLAPEKELGRLEEVATVPGTRLVVVGDGPSRVATAVRLAEAVASMPGRPNRSPVLLGQHSGMALARAYAALDLFVHTGTRETFGQTLQEAAASGIPVIAPARGGPLDLVDHGVTGLLFDPDLAGDLHRCVRDLVERPAGRSAMGAGGRARVEGRTWECVVADLVQHYRVALDHGLSAA